MLAALAAATPLLAAALPGGVWTACALAFLLGGVPFGLVLVRLFTGQDIRRIGSGNVGATNASRVFAGRKRLAVFFGIYVLDFAKGLLPVLLFPGLVGLAEGDLAGRVWIGAAAIAGHCFSPFLRFKGGKGVATTTGVLAALHPIALVAALLAFGIVLGMTRRVYLGSLALGATLPVVVIASDPQAAFADRLPLTVLCLVIAAFLVYTHRSNIAAARAGRPA